MKFVVQDCGRDFIMELKENRKMALSKEDKAIGKYVSIKESCTRRACRFSLRGAIGFSITHR